MNTNIKLMNNATFEKKNREKYKKTEILNLSQQKEEGIILYQYQSFMLQCFSQKVIGNRNELLLATFSTSIK